MNDDNILFGLIGFIAGLALGCFIVILLMGSPAAVTCDYLANELNLVTMVANDTCYVETESGNIVPLAEWVR